MSDQHYRLDACNDSSMGGGKRCYQSKRSCLDEGEDCYSSRIETPKLNWVNSDAKTFLMEWKNYDLVIQETMYPALHNAHDTVLDLQVRNLRAQIFIQKRVELGNYHNFSVNTHVPQGARLPRCSGRHL